MWCDSSKYHQYSSSINFTSEIVAALVIFVEDEDQTSWFASAQLEAEVDFENVSLIKDDVSTVSASFKSW